MIDISTLRGTDSKILCIGSYPAIIQSMLDFDYLSGKNEPSITAIVASGRKIERYFFGNKEIAIRVYPSISDIPELVLKNITLFANLVSGRRVLDSTVDAMNTLPHVLGGALFAEDVPEIHALDLYRMAREKNILLIGPASVGLLIPNILKLGAIGGVDHRQFSESNLFSSGGIAVFSASGGMTNEIIRIVAHQKKALSFALSFGGDRFPVLSPQDALLLAEQDPETNAIIYFGELGGTDEYTIAEMLAKKKITRPLVAFIAGTISDLFEEPPQFGHAKAMAKTGDERAVAKRTVLQEAGALVPQSFSEFVRMIKGIPNSKDNISYNTSMDPIGDRRKSLFVSSVSYDQDGVAKVLDEDLLTFAKNNSFAKIAIALFLGKKSVSKELESFTDFILRLLVDHGPYVSGAVNTMVASRAGKDLSASLASGLLTIGPRFGGAINQSAENWLMGVKEKKSASEFVESFASQKQYIAGIGHRKYRIDMPDPRVVEILQFSEKLKRRTYSSFAKDVELITTAKKGNLILNVDGAIASVLLDILSEKEHYSHDQLKELIELEFFNALFVLSRSVGFIAHFIDQKRLDEGLFRLEESDVVHVTQE